MPNGQASAAFQSGDFQKLVWPKAKKFLKIGVFGMSADAMFCGVLPFDPLGERECGAGHGIGAHSAGA